MNNKKYGTAQYISTFIFLIAFHETTTFILVHPINPCNNIEQRLNTKHRVINLKWSTDTQ